VKIKDVERLLASHAELVHALRSVMPFVDDAEDVQNVFPESAMSNACRSAVAICRSAVADAEKVRAAIERPL
jgi:hypothetical protein